MEIEFKNLLELKNRIEPAIKSKAKEFNKIKEEEIWNYLKSKWKNGTNLTLYDLINDIMNLKEIEIEEYKRSDKNDQS